MMNIQRLFCIFLLAAALPQVAAAQMADSHDQDAINAMNSGVSSGAIINTDIGCAILTGFLNGPDLAAFGALFPDDGCKGGTFEKARPNGKVDLHMNGDGLMFLMVMDPFNFFSSDGSHVKWNIIWQEGGASVLKINGTLSDGSRVRGHFTVNLNGEDEAQGDFLWIEGIGYVVGRL